MGGVDKCDPDIVAVIWVDSKAVVQLEWCGGLGSLHGVGVDGWVVVP